MLDPESYLREGSTSMDRDQQRRIANNEVMFRDHNELIGDAVDSFQADDDVVSTHGVMCECAFAGCKTTLDLTMAQYREGRSDPTWFIVVPDHAVEEVEHMVYDRTTYWIIQKDGLGRKIAEDQAPTGDS